MKIASIFCSAMSFCAFAIRAMRSSSAMGTMPAVIGVSALIAGGRSELVEESALAGEPGAQAAAAAPAPIAAAPRNSRRFMPRFYSGRRAL